MAMDLTGTTFARLTVIGPTIHVKKKLCAPCICECGQRRTIPVYSLKSGNTKSCGCYNREAVKFRRIKHGHTSGVRGGRGVRPSPEYMSWQNARNRCFNKKSDHYQQYGARGITMCEEWATNFEAFFSYMGPRPVGMSLDRIDNNGNYEPGNCRWATTEQQRNNTQQCVFYDWNGQRLTLAQISRAVGIPRLVIYKRIKRGWPFDRAVSEPKH